MGRLASFNVDSNQWKKFKELAQGQGQTASYWLNVFIRQTIEAGEVNFARSVSSLVAPVSPPATDKIYTAIESKTDQIYTAIDELIGRLTALETRTQSISALADKVASLEQSLSSLQPGKIESGRAEVDLPKQASNPTRRLIPKELRGQTRAKPEPVMVEQPPSKKPPRENQKQKRATPVGLTTTELAKKEGLSLRTVFRWAANTEPGSSPSARGKNSSIAERLILGEDKRWYAKN